jgi:hypothetical protein
METQKLVIARHVAFDETKFPARTSRNEDYESESEASTKQFSDISVLDDEVDGASSSDESQVFRFGEFEAFLRSEHLALLGGRTFYRNFGRRSVL